MYDTGSRRLRRPWRHGRAGKVGLARGRVGGGSQSEERGQNGEGGEGGAWRPRRDAPAGLQAARRAERRRGGAERPTCAVQGAAHVADHVGHQKLRCKYVIQYCTQLCTAPFPFSSLSLMKLNVCDVAILFSTCGTFRMKCIVSRHPTPRYAMTLKTVPETNDAKLRQNR